MKSNRTGLVLALAFDLSAWPLMSNTQQATNGARPNDLLLLLARADEVIE